MSRSAGPAIRGGMPLSHAFGLAVAVEALLIAVVVWRLQPPADRPPPPVMVMQVEHVDLPVTPPPKPIEPLKPVEPQSQRPASPPVQPVQSVPPKPMAKPQRPPPRPTSRPQQPPSMATAEPVAEPSVAPAAESPEVPMPPLPTLTAAQQDAAIRFESLLRAAVQDAAHFPAAAKGRQGRVRIGLDFLDGQASGIAVVQSGDFAPFDEAAKAAVEEAHYPPPPNHLQHQVLHLLVWVEFLRKGS